VKADPIAWRLRSQKLVGTTCRTPAEVVGWLGAMEAQDYLYVLCPAPRGGPLLAANSHLRVAVDVYREQ
jgi:hypothetical protein